MALDITIEGTGVIANADAISDTAGGTWFEEGGGTVSLSNDVYLIGTASIGGKYASKSGVLGIDKGSGLYDFTTGTGAQSGQMIYIWIAATAIGTLDTLSTYPLCVRISSAVSTSTDTTYSDYLIAGNDDANGWTGGWKCFVIDPTQTPSRNAGATHASIIASVRSIGIWIDCSTSARADSFFIGGIAIGSGLRITDTSTAGWTDTVNYCTDYANRGWGMFQEREGIYYAYGIMNIGGAVDGSGTADNKVTSFVDAGKIIQFGTSEYCTDAAGTWVTSIPVSGSGINIEDTASYNTVFRDGILVGTDEGRAGSSFIGNDLLDVSLDLYGGNNATSITTLYGTTLKDIRGYINSGDDSDHKFYGISVAGCSQFDPVGSSAIRNSTFAETEDLDSAVLWNSGMDMEYCSFIANVSGAAIEHPLVISATYTGLTFSGNTKDILYSAPTSSGELLITSLFSDVSSYEITNTTGNTVRISNDVVITITVKDENGDEVENAQTAVYRTSDDVELMNEDTTAGVATTTYNYTVDVPVYFRVRKSTDGATRYFPLKGTGIITDSGLSISVTLIEDTIVT